MISRERILPVVTRIVGAETNDFEELTKMAGLDPAKDFRGADLRGVDFGKADLTGYDFSGADLRGANFSDAKIEAAILTGSLLGGETAPPSFVQAANHAYGPFHRVASTTQTEQDALKQKEMGQILGRAGRGSSVLTVKAYRGSLPPNHSGVEFFTSVSPNRGSASPFEARWYAGDFGVSVIKREGEEFAAIPAFITKVEYRRL